MSVNLDTVTRHPLSAVFGDMEELERKDLKDSVNDIGFTDPYIIIKDGQVIDGWNRLSVGRELGRVSELSDALFEDVFDAGMAPSVERYVLAKNLSRRHLSASKRATIVAQLLMGSMSGDESVIEDSNSVSLQEAADMASVSIPTMIDAKKVIKAGKIDEILECDKSVSAVAKDKTLKKRGRKTQEEKESELEVAAAALATKEEEVETLSHSNTALTRRQAELERENTKLLKENDGLKIKILELRTKLIKYEGPQLEA